MMISSNDQFYLNKDIIHNCLKQMKNGYKIIKPLYTDGTVEVIHVINATLSFSLLVHPAFEGHLYTKLCRTVTLCIGATSTFSGATLPSFPATLRSVHNTPPLEH